MTSHPAPAIIHKLVETFEQNLDSYRSSKNETELRREFLDKFFTALGWDVANEKGYDEAGKEVVHEFSVDVAGQQKKADYAFRAGRGEKFVFLVEAKKPSVKIETSQDATFQIRRYGWSAKLPINILTDFEHFAVYDCRAKPSYNDKASMGRIMLVHYKDYVSRWNEIVEIFSPEAVRNGSFARYAEGMKGKKGAADVDDAFLQEIERWREALAKNIALRNEEIDVPGLNYAVQMTIDRIVFLRICEERGIEPENQLQEIISRDDVYQELRELFKRADTKYNSGLFHFKKEKNQNSHPDELTLNLEIDDKVLKDIVSNLYYPKSPYAFLYIPSDILGQVYERFLGKVIRLTAGHSAKVEEKPEVRKAGGVYYTPTYIVEYIVKNTVGKLVENKSPKDVASLKIVDPACGSGTFLLGAYQFLLDWHLKWYINNEPEKWASGKSPAIYKPVAYYKQAEVKEDADGRRVIREGVAEVKGEWKLTVAQKREILTNNIYGVDIDAQAVEVTKLSLLLKVLENGSGQLGLGMERILPDLGNNIQCGNSLISYDYFEGRLLHDEDERRRINPFNWKSDFKEIFLYGGFDAVIGNPPYRIVTEANLLSYFDRRYYHQDYQKDLYMLFLERYEKILKSEGLLGVIVSNTWLQSVTLQSIRKYMTSCYKWLNVLYLPEKVFKAVVDTHVLIFQKSDSGIQEDDSVIVDIMKNGQARQYHVLNGKFIPKQGEPINVVANPAAQSLFRKTTLSAKQLGDLFSVFNGVKPFEIGKGNPPQTAKIAQEQPFVVEGKAPAKKWKPLLRGGLIHRYANNWDNNYWILYGEWLAAPRDPAIFDAPKKIMVRQTGDSIIATVIESGFVARNNMHIILSKTSDYALEYLLGLMNSKLMDFAYRFINPEKGEALAEVKKKHVEQLPIRAIDFSNPAEKSQHDKMVSLVEQMMEIHKQLAKAKTPQEKKGLERQIHDTDSSIDSLVYELYGLNEEEIKIVEGR